MYMYLLKSWCHTSVLNNLLYEWFDKVDRYIINYIPKWLHLPISHIAVWGQHSMSC
jgi:hypothetical protein